MDISKIKSTPAAGDIQASRSRWFEDAAKQRRQDGDEYPRSARATITEERETGRLYGPYRVGIEYLSGADCTGTVRAVTEVWRDSLGDACVAVSNAVRIHGLARCSLEIVTQAEGV